MDVWGGSAFGSQVRLAIHQAVLAIVLLGLFAGVRLRVLKTNVISTRLCATVLSASLFNVASGNGVVSHSSVHLSTPRIMALLTLSPTPAAAARGAAGGAGVHVPDGETEGE